jgi:hypothetical protein
VSETARCAECGSLAGTHTRDCPHWPVKATCPETSHGFHEPDREGRCRFCRKKVTYGVPRPNPRYFRTTSNRNSADLNSLLYDRHNPYQDPSVDEDEGEYYER